MIYTRTFWLEKEESNSVFIAKKAERLVLKAQDLHLLTSSALSINYCTKVLIAEREFCNHMDELLSEVLVSTNRMADLLYTDTKEIIRLIEFGSVDEKD